MSQCPYCKETLDKVNYKQVIHEQGEIKERSVDAIPELAHDSFETSCPECGEQFEFTDITDAQIFLRTAYPAL